GELIDNPDPEPFNNSNTVMKYTKFEGAPFAGTVLPLDQSINFSDGSLLKAKVNAPRAGASLTFKLESPTGSNEVVVTNKKISEWELMVFDFSGMEKEDYNAITLIWDNGTAGAGTSDWVFLMDEIEVRDQINTGSTLASLSINDTLVTSFNSDVLMYSFELPVDLTDIPLITAVPVDERAIVDIQTPSTIPGTVEILVIAEDGENQTQYAVALSAKEAPLNVAEEFVLLHPNPASDRIYLQSDLQIKADDLKLFDLSGQVYPVEWKEDRVGISGNISSLPSGIYFVSFGDRSAGYKFLKNR
ncbi:MAG: T9SS type A sorting domain-containing protein, partial [Ekhidna sp.]|nr:T9SS type A sorting domain-containing protein [Ekhidna sp.]